jgi:hypothetical protein
MITMETDRLVDDYLGRLDTAAAHLPRARRAELVAEIREHIEAALGQESDSGEVAVRNVLERLGSPEEIVDAAEPTSAAAARVGKLDIAALVVLVVPFVGWLFGSALVVASAAWTRREKIIGVALALTPVLLPLLGLVADGTSRPVHQGPIGEPGTPEEDGAGMLEVAVILFLLFAGLPSALYLGWRLRRHRERPADSGANARLP